MASPSVAEYGAGATFGAALLVSGVYSPEVIVSQLKLSNFHMLEAFLTASAVSALVVLAADKSGLVPVNIREPRTLRILPGIPFSANIIGGAALGVGMALTGACPGTVLVQIATGVRSGLYVAAGGLLGAVGFSIVQPWLLSQPQVGNANRKPSKNLHVIPGSTANTVQSKLGLSADSTLLIYETMCLSMIAASVSLAPKGASYLPPALGGLFIGAAQAATLLMTRRTVGVSGAYGDLGNWLVGLFRGRPTKFLTSQVLFALGILSGSALLAVNPKIVVRGDSIKSPGPLLAFAGGIASIFGARLAGGCTSGHGISGMATFSVASFVTVAAMFGGGIAAATLLA